MVLIVECAGSPYEVGYKHGSAAKQQVIQCIDLYAHMFASKCDQSWPQVQETARKYEQHIRAQWPHYHEEIRGVADGAGRDILDIVALNVRTEIRFGQYRGFSDGCTSVSWHGENRAWLGQNWDWVTDDKKNLVVLKIAAAEDRPRIVMITEAGIIGKIGFNEHGVGVCLNAIQAKGCDPTKIPVHLALRTALDSSSAKEAVAKLSASGISSSAHILLADDQEAFGCEFTATTFVTLPMDVNGSIVHSNHLLVNHPGVYEPHWLNDSVERVTRMGTLVKDLAETDKQLSLEDFEALFKDETNFPTAICRKQEGVSEAETLFNITMNLKERKGLIKMGRPTNPEETITIQCN